MKRIKVLLSIVICVLLLGGCGDSSFFDKDEIKQLIENCTIHSGEVHKCITGKEEYKEAVLLETVFQYTDVYDNSEGPDWAHVYSKYQMQDGSVIYFATIITDMKGIGKLSDNPIWLHPIEEQEYNYTYNRNLAVNGEDESGDLELEGVGHDVYAYEAPDGSGCHYYFIVK